MRSRHFLAALGFAGIVALGLLLLLLQQVGIDTSPPDTPAPLATNTSGQASPGQFGATAAIETAEPAHPAAAFSSAPVTPSLPTPFPTLAPIAYPNLTLPSLPVPNPPYLPGTINGPARYDPLAPLAPGPPIAPSGLGGLPGNDLLAASPASLVPTIPLPLGLDEDEDAPDVGVTPAPSR